MGTQQMMSASLMRFMRNKRSMQKMTETMILQTRYKRCLLQATP